MAETLKKINVTIAGRDYPVKVKETEVDMIVRVATEINRKLKELQLQYNKNDLQDCLSMTLLTYAVEASQNTRNPKRTSEDFTDKFNRLDALVDSILQS